MQKKEMSSELISNRVLQVMNLENQEVVCYGIKKKTAEGKENVDKAVSFNELQGCTLNFTFNYV